MIHSKIMQDLLAARRSKQQDKATLLATLTGEMLLLAEMKEGKKVIPDEVALRVLRKFAKGIDEMLTYRPNDAKLQSEKAIVASYLPATLGEEATRQIIQQLIANGTDNIGAIMKYMNETFRERCDKTLASRIAKELLNNA